MIIEHFILAKGAAVDTTTNQLSLFELIEDVTVQGAALPLDIAVNVIGVLRRTPDDPPDVTRRYELAIDGPGPKRMLLETIEVQMAPHHRRNRVRFMLNIALETAGPYRASLRDAAGAGHAHVIEFQVTTADAPTMVQ